MKSGAFHRPFWASLLLTTAIAGVSPALAQDSSAQVAAKAPEAATTPATTPAVAPATEPAAIEPGPSEPDPLTPAATNDGPAKAPGAEAAKPADPAKQVDPIVAAVRSILTASEAGAPKVHKDDAAALAAYYADGDGQPLWTHASGLTVRAKDVMEEIKRAADYGLDPAAFALPTTPAAGAGAEVLAEAEIALSRAVLTYARHARGGRVVPSSLSNMIDYKPPLFEPKSVLQGISASMTPDFYLRDMQPKHAGFEKLRQALLAVRKGGEATAALGFGDAHKMPSDIERRILVNMERWRWLPAKLGEFYVWDNVPEQITRAVRDDKVVLQERIVVGKAHTQTPEFTAPMRFVIFHPSWGVPSGIKTNELAPMLRRASQNSMGLFDFFGGGSSGGASRALARHELKVYRNGQPVNPDSVNWASADIRQFHFTQPPSAKNVLGIVKFRFPNRFDVYMHDTTERHLFNQSVRAFSHGCMRVQNPIKLAEVILDYDKGWSPEKVRGLARQGGTRDVTLDKNVPVYITYFTAMVDDDGKLRLRSDLYGRDQRLASALAGRHVSMDRIAGEKPEREKSTRAASASKERRRPARPRTKTAKQEPVFNPFASGAFSN